MICEHCKKTFKDPLELYNGEWACPLCHKFIRFASGSLSVTRANDELFTLSEVCYLRALKISKSQEYQKQLKKAINLCKEAARLNHPKAVMRMGYYYEMGYVSFDGVEAFKMACEYYKRVWNAKSIDVQFKGGAVDDGYACDGSEIKLKTRAAELYLDLLKNAPEKFAGNKSYSYSDALSEIRLSGLPVSRQVKKQKSNEENRAAKTLEILESCFSKDRAPVFGILRFDGEEFLNLMEICESGRNDKRPSLLRYAERLDIYMIEVETGRFQAIKTAGNASGIKTNGKYYMYFFNTCGKHAFSQGKLKQIKKFLERGVMEFDKVLSIAQKAQMDFADYIFYDDDILVYKSRSESVAHAAQELIDSIVQGE